MMKKLLAAVLILGLVVGIGSTGVKVGGSTTYGSPGGGGIGGDARP